ncbi:hypothetical protein L195_g002761 [Trifolium pratense]|uniref:Uncharacterized protein n=1 Tax=Trifolium pratense TaxID=57577 RepID=A0A2K3NTD7_TRIPR|nr:hypothetical protein L195_g002761 [Trifolium pratense]
MITSLMTRLQIMSTTLYDLKLEDKDNLEGDYPLEEIYLAGKAPLTQSHPSDASHAPDHATCQFILKKEKTKHHIQRVQTQIYLPCNPSSTSTPPCYCISFVPCVAVKPYYVSSVEDPVFICWWSVQPCKAASGRCQLSKERWVPWVTWRWWASPYMKVEEVHHGSIRSEEEAVGGVYFCGIIWSMRCIRRVKLSQRHPAFSHSKVM